MAIPFEAVIIPAFEPAVCIHCAPPRIDGPVFDAPHRCDTLKLAMIKTERLARKLFNGNIYDCICSYEPAPC
jgi:hypothetical protein